MSDRNDDQAVQTSVDQQQMHDGHLDNYGYQFRPEDNQAPIDNYQYYGGSAVNDQMELQSYNMQPQS
jgi:hypothetical protein